MKYIWIGAFLLIGLSAASAQSPAFSEVRELTMSFTGAVDVETHVGAINVQGWDNDFVSIRATITGDRPTIPGMVQINLSSSQISTAGPAGESWSVSFEISMPRRADLRAHTNVGAISITDLTGVLSAQTDVGAIVLTRVGGDVDARSHVGAVTAGLTGISWEGKGLSLLTNTGAIHLTAPFGYSAHFDLRTTLGGITTNAAGARLASLGFLGRKLVFDTGVGPTIRATTSVGQIDLTFVPEP